MRFPDFIYQPTPKGLDTGLVPGRFARTIELTQAAVMVLLAVPPSGGIGINLERVLVINGFATFAQGGGAQVVNDIQVRVTDAAGFIIVDVARRELLAVAQASLDRQDMELVLMPDEFLQVQVLFSAGAVGNTVRFSAHGTNLNRGNFFYSTT